MCTFLVKTQIPKNHFEIKLFKASLNVTALKRLFIILFWRKITVVSVIVHCCSAGLLSVSDAFCASVDLSFSPSCPSFRYRYKGR